MLGKESDGNNLRHILQLENKNNFVKLSQSVSLDKAITQHHYRGI